jgi:hypothetical protein
LASWSSTSFFSVMESRYSIILVFRLAHRSCVMQRPASSPMQFSLPPQPVASIGSSTATMMSATVISPLAAQRITAAGATGAFHQLMPAQLAEQLLEVGQRDLLALADGRQRHRAIVPERRPDRSSR